MAPTVRHAVGSSHLASGHDLGGDHILKFLVAAAVILLAFGVMAWLADRT